jgi:4a-hydroxytetrahydrobiopterin dehydratase
MKLNLKLNQRKAGMTDSIQEQVTELGNGWKLENNILTKRFELENFMACVKMVNQVAELAETANHHPDLKIENYKEVTISLTTHSEGKVTQKDVELAKEIEELK